ncbi:hypothetical protein [Dyadobacter bucti]|uniref:hypothetical protein n=1 Tax=Dyadobacter bucti TaxID=2572203 RepID=UPI001108A8A1|nr:hypothetical protein [Dyadobacter bucti]
MTKNRLVFPVLITIIAAVGISSCTYRSYHPGYDYGYGYGYRYAPPPPRVVVVKPAPRRIVRADRHRSSRYNDRSYRRQYNRGNHYGHDNGRTRGPRR